MESPICYNTITGCDDLISQDERFAGYTPESIANLRALYDEYRKKDNKAPFLQEYEDKDIPTDKVNELADILYTFRKEALPQTGRLALKSLNSGTTLADSFLSLGRAMPPTVIQEHAEYIAYLFSAVANSIATEHNRKNPSNKITRLDVIKGVKGTNGKILYGEAAIFDAVYQYIAGLYIKNGHGDHYNTLMFWGPLCMWARTFISKSERVNLGVYKDYGVSKTVEIDDVNIDALVANDYDPEASTKESWQEEKDKLPLLSRVLDEIKRVLAAIVDETPSAKKTILNYPKRIDLEDAHHWISNVLMRVPNAESMELIFKEYHDEYMEGKKTATEKAPFYPSVEQMIGHAVYEAIQRDPSLKTAFFVSYHTGFTLFGAMKQYVKKNAYGIYDFFHSILNRQYNSQKNVTWAHIDSPNFNSSLFRNNEDGTITFSETAAEEIDNIIEILTPIKIEGKKDSSNILDKLTAYKPAKLTSELLGKNKKKKAKAAQELALILNKLGIVIDENIILKGLSNNSINRNFIDNVLNVYTALSELLAKESIDYRKEIRKFSELGKAMDDLLSEIGLIKQSFDYEARAVVLDKNGNKSSVSSMQAPCYFTDFVDTVLFYYKKMVNASDPEEALAYKNAALEFINSRYKNVELFVEESTTPEGNIIETIDNVILKNIIDSFEGKSDYLDNFKHERFAQMDIFGREQRTEKLSDIDVALSMFHNYLFAKKNEHKYAQFPLFILGDSGVHRYMTAPIYSNDEVLDHFLNIIEKEINLQKLIEAANSYLKDNNFGEISGTKKGISISWLQRVQKHYENIQKSHPQITDYRSRMKKAIKQVLDEDYADFMSHWYEKGLMEQLEYGSKGFKYFGTIREDGKNIPLVTTEKEAKTLLQNFVYNYALNTVCQLQMMTISTMYYKSLEELQKRYKEIHASGTSLNVDAIDPSTGQKIFVNENGEFYPYETCVYFDDIIIDVSKTDPDFAKVVKDTVGAQDYARYLENTLTDGQSYRSISSYRKIAIAQKRWTEAQEQWYNKYLEFKRKNKGEEFTDEQLQELASYEITFQPQKPYLFTHERFTFADKKTKQKHTLLIPVQHKCAEVVLIPELLRKNSGLRAIAETMEENHIDVVCSTEVVKVGMFGSVDISYKTNKDNLFVDKEGKVIPSADGKTKGITRADQKKNPEFSSKAVALHGSRVTGIKEALGKGYRHQLDLSTYYRQQNVPSHVNDPRALGTQMRKMFFTAIESEGDYSLYFPELTDEEGKTQLLLFDKNNPVDVGSQSGRGGINVCNFYNALICQNIIEAFEQLEKDLASTETLAPILQQMSLNSGRNVVYDIMNLALAIESGENEDKAIKDFLLPLCDPAMSEDNQAALISLFRNNVNKQIMCGGSAVQASSFGIEELVEDDSSAESYRDIHTPDDGSLKVICEYEKDKNGNYVLDENGERKPVNVLYAECEMPFDFSYVDYNGKTVHLEYDDYCDREGNLLPNTRGIKDEDGNLLSKLDVEFPGMRDLVAYRIPTERAYSAINLKIKKFTRKDIGGIIKVPSAFTTIAGFDFDIDKLYFLRKEFVAQRKTLTPTDKKEVWDAVFDEHSDVTMALEIARLKHKGEKITIDGKETIIDDKTPRNQLRGLISLTDYGYDENVTLQNLFDQKVRELGVDRQFESYDYTKTVNENSRTARNNEILRLIQCRLSDAETLPARYTPGGFEPHKQSAKEMRVIYAQKTSEGFTEEKLTKLASDKDNDYKVNYSILNPWTFITYNKQNQAAGELIGIFANQNINHIFASIANKLELKEGIAFAGKKPLKNLLKNPEGVDTEVTTAGFLAASVDAVKDPVLNFMNLNSITADTGALLARLGYNTTEIALLFNQPIIREVCDYYFNNHMSDLSKAINKVRAKYAANTSRNAAVSSLSKENMIRSIIDHNNNKIQNIGLFNNSQLDALDVFEKAYRSSQELVAFVRATKFTALKSIESSAGGLYHQQRVVTKYIEQNASEDNNLIIWPSKEVKSAITDFSSYDILGEDRQLYLNNIMLNPFAFEQVMYDMTRMFTEKVLNKYFPYETPVFKGIRDRMTAATKNEVLSSDSINTVHKDLVLYMLSRMEGSLLNANTLVTDSAGIQYYAPNYYKNIFPQDFFKKLSKLPTDDIKNNAFLTSVELGQGKSGNYYLTIANLMGANSKIKLELMQGWSELALADPNTEEGKVKRQLSRDLFIYCLYNTGYNIGPKSFIHLATIFVKEQLLTQEGQTYPQFLRALLQGKVTTNLDMDEFISLYIKNHTDDYQFTYTPYNFDEQEALEEIALTESGDYKDEIILSYYKGDRQEPTSYAGKVFLGIHHQEGSPVYIVKSIPAILLGNQLYMLKTEDDHDGELGFNARVKLGDITATYVKADILGVKGTINYYGGVDDTVIDNKQSDEDYSFEEENSDSMDEIFKKIRKLHEIDIDTVDDPFAHYNNSNDVDEEGKIRHYKVGKREFIRSDLSKKAAILRDKANARRFMHDFLELEEQELFSTTAWADNTRGLIAYIEKETGLKIEDVNLEDYVVSNMPTLTEEGKETVSCFKHEK